MEQLYKDFIEKALPKIQEGLVITKDYFLDLAGRYIKYLVISDAVYLLFWSIVLGVSLRLSARRKTREWCREDQDRYLVFIPLATSIIISLFCVFIYMDNLIQDIFVPEIRIMKELAPLIK